MKRWIVRAGASSLDDMFLEDAPTPEPGSGEVRIKVHAVSLNRRDELLLAGGFGPASTDFVPVSDGAGVIDAIGEGVADRSVGDRVIANYYPTWRDGPPAPDQGWGLGSPGQDGLLSEYAILKADRVTAVPPSLTFAEAACLPCAALTAWSALNGNRPYKRPLESGARVLVTGTGGVAIFSILIAKAVGAEVVVTTSDDAKTDRIKALGASAVVNYRTNDDWGTVASDLSGGFDYVVNAAGPGVLDQAFAAAAPGGEIALMGLFEFGDKPLDLIPVMARGLSLRGISVGSAAAFADLVRFVDEHRIKVPIAARFGFDDAKDAYRLAASGTAFGKVIIDVPRLHSQGVTERMN